MKIVIHRNECCFQNYAKCEVYGPYESSAEADEMVGKIVNGYMDEAFSYDGFSFAGWDVRKLVDSGVSQEEARERARTIFVEVVDLETKTPRERYDEKKLR